MTPATDPIVVGQYDDFATAEAARAELRASGVRDGDTEIYQLNAPGQHDRYPIGGDEDVDRGARGGAEGAGAGAAIGGVVGLAAGAAAIPVVGPLAAVAGIAAGAYVGSMRGAVGTMGEHGQEEARAVSVRPAGVRLAVHVTNVPGRDAIVATLRRHGARSIELGAGEWDAGWVDFDPVSTPHWLMAPAPL